MKYNYKKRGIRTALVLAFWSVLAQGLFAINMDGCKPKNAAMLNIKSAKGIPVPRMTSEECNGFRISASELRKEVRPLKELLKNKK